MGIGIISQSSRDAEARAQAEAEARQTINLEPHIVEALNGNDELAKRSAMNEIIETVFAYMRLSMAEGTSEADLQKLGRNLLKNFGITKTWDDEKYPVRVYFGQNADNPITLVPHYADPKATLDPGARGNNMVTFVTRPRHGNITALGVSSSFAYRSAGNRIALLEKPFSTQLNVSAQLSAYDDLDRVVMSANGETTAAELYKALVKRLSIARVRTDKDKRLGHVLNPGSIFDRQPPYGIQSDNHAKLSAVGAFCVSVPMVITDAWGNKSTYRQGRNYMVRDGVVYRLNAA